MKIARSLPLFVFLLLTGCGNSQQAGQSPLLATDAQQSLAISFQITADSTLALFTNLNVRKGSTVRDITAAVVKVDYGDPAKQFITGLAGRKAGTAEREFWALYVNDSLAQEGAATLAIHTPAAISWRLQTY